MQAGSGFDNVSGDQSKDDLDRWRFALDIASVICATPREWSVRIGIFGPWGFGKSTVLKYIGDKFASDGDIVIYFTPSFESNFSDAVGAFGTVLIDELTRQGLSPEPTFKSWLRKQKWWRSTNTAEVIGASSEWFKAAKLANAGLGVLSLWLKHSSSEIQRITLGFPDQRFVVLIDDLDRTSPELLPKFLLSLREILDLPGFAFVMGFDEGIVSRALAEQDTKAKAGQGFLEKILDFRFSLPPIESSSKLKLLKRALQEYAPFVPLNSTAEVEDLIPDNPREIKALVRGMLSVKSVVERHEANEFKWIDVWLVHLLRQESQALLQALLVESVLENTVGVSYQLLRKTSKRSGSESSDTDPLDALLAPNRVPEASIDRVRKIIAAMRSRSTSQLRYVLGWLMRQPALTWKEFDQILSEWLDCPTPEELQAALKSHAASRQEVPERVEQEFIEAVCGRVGEKLEACTRFTRSAELDAAYKDVHPLRLIARAFFRIPEMLRPDRFKLFYQQAQYWGNVRRSPEEILARNVERDDLLEMARLISRENAVEVFAEMAPWAGGATPAFYDEGGVRIALRNDVASVLKPIVVSKLVEFLAEGESLKKLSENGRFPAYKGLIFGYDGRLEPSVEEALVVAISLASGNPYAVQNAEALAALIISALNYRADVNESDARLFVANGVLVRELWKTLSAETLLPRGAIRLLALREKLISCDVRQEALPLNIEMEAQRAYFDQHRDEVMRSI